MAGYNADMSKTQPTPCCPAMAELNDAYPGFHEGFEPDGPTAWTFNGCCRGECYLLTGVRFCPFCGAPMAGADPSFFRSDLAPGIAAASPSPES